MSSAALHPSKDVRRSDLPARVVRKQKDRRDERQSQLSSHQRNTVGQCQLDDNSAGHLTLQSLAGDIAREPARVLDDDPVNQEVMG